jgi:hypothetical protein
MNSRFAMEKTNLVQLELPTNILAQLMEKGYVCAADFRCLNCKSKQCVQKLCLKNCAKCLFTKQNVDLCQNECNSCELQDFENSKIF